jgi:DNA-binding GntR family transcriptional regulator
MSSPLSELTPALPRRTGGEVVAAFVRSLIYDGRLRPGDRVPQREVARLLSLSKVPVREGLIALEREGLLTFDADRVAIVNPLDANAIQDSFDIFGVVYGYAAHCALERGGDETLKRFAEINAAIQSADDPEDVQRLALAFHTAVLAAADSPRINAVLRATARAHMEQVFRQVPEVAKLEVRGIGTINRALQRGDLTKAADEYLRILRREGKLLVAAFTRRGLFVR